jgi:hypothetical protein
MAPVGVNFRNFLLDPERLHLDSWTADTFARRFSR